MRHCWSVNHGTNEIYTFLQPEFTPLEDSKLLVLCSAELLGAADPGKALPNATKELLQARKDLLSFGQIRIQPRIDLGSHAWKDHQSSTLILLS